MERLGYVSFNLRVIKLTRISALQGLLSPVGKAIVLPLGAVTLGEALGVVDALGTGAVSVTGVTSQACFKD